MTLTNKTTESSIIEILSVPEDLQPKVLETLKSEALRPDVQLISQRLARKKGEELTDLSESQAAERVAIAVLSLFPDADAAKPCLKGLRKFFADGLKLMPSQVSQVLGAATLKAFTQLSPGDRDVIKALPFRTAYEVSKLEPEQQAELIEQHFNKEVRKPNVISTQDVVSFRNSQNVDTCQKSEQLLNSSEVDTCQKQKEQELLALAPSLRTGLILDLIRAKVKAGLKDPANAARVKGFARELQRLGELIEIQADQV